MQTELATDDVTDQIAYIEMNRQVRTKEAGLAVACGEALRKLQELMDGQRAALNRPDSATSPANVDALAVEIEKVKRLGGAANAAGPAGNQPRRREQRVPRENARHTPARNKTRRSMGRTGER